MTSASFKISIENLKEVQKQLKNIEKRTPYAIQKGVNKVATTTKRRLREELKKTYTLKDAKFNKTVNIKRATLQDLTASMLYKGGPTSMMHFNVSPRSRSVNKKGRKAASAQIKKANSKKQFVQKSGGKTYKAFVANLANGNLLMATRTPGNKIKTFYSASYPKMVENEKVYDVVEPEMQKMLKEHIEQQLERYMRY